MPVSSIFILFVLIVLYGLAWHDKPAHPPERQDNRKQPPQGNSTLGEMHEYKPFSRLLRPSNRSRTSALPHRFNSREKRALEQTTP
jgi:hypothetical protein